PAMKKTARRNGTVTGWSRRGAAPRLERYVVVEILARRLLGRAGARPRAVAHAAIAGIGGGAAAAFEHLEIALEARDHHFGRGFLLPALLVGPFARLELAFDEDL